MEFLKRLFNDDGSHSFRWKKTESGLCFPFPPGWHKKRFRECLATYQYLVLQQLLEAGEARQEKDSFHVESEVLCRLDPMSRQLLDLPEVWPGKFELETSGRTTDKDFTLFLRALPPAGMAFLRTSLEDPFLKVDDTLYLPDAAQWLALHAVQEHEAIPSGERDEAVNLRAVYAIQQACKQGAAIDTRMFSTLTIEIPNTVSVNAIENQDGSLRLVPDFGLGLSPEAVENRLGQLTNQKEDAVLHVGKTLVLLDERRLKATREILSSRLISAREKWQFFKTPGAYLDASLVDLDTGFSLRVHGMEIFQKAYFGQTENDPLAWFEETVEKADSVLLENCLPLIDDENDFSELQKHVNDAVANRQTSVQFKEKTILLSEDAEKTQQIMEKLRNALRKKLENTEDNPPEEKPAKAENSQQVTVKIDLNDENLPEGLPKETPVDQPYTDTLYPEELHYAFHTYQEKGTRWLLNLMLPSLKQNPNIFCGGLLADDMGLGKTFMVLAALNVYLHQVKRGTAKPILAVMPVVLLENWQDEIKKVFKNSPFDDVLILHGACLNDFRQKGSRPETLLPQGEELHIRYSLKVGPDFGSKRLDMPGRLILTNYDTLRDYQFSLCRVDWGCVIFDEAQEIKNSNTIKSRAAKGLKSDFRLAVTGTPVENSLSDFWSIYDTVKPGLLGAFQDFRRTYMIPIDQCSSSEEKDKKRIEIGRKLRQTVDPFMLRRTKEDNLSGLPRKIIHDGMEDETYSAVMDRVQLKSYNAVISTVVAAKQSGDASRVQQIILPSLRKLQSVSLHPAFLDDGGQTLIDTSQSWETLLPQSAKLVLLLKILDEIRERKEKVIIFVINKVLQRFLAYALGERYNLSISIVNGETRSVSTSYSSADVTRKKLIKDFEAQNGFNIICMSPLAAGVGLTIVGANNVIHLERHWNPAKEAQATDRVYRLGAKRDVHVYIPILKHPEKQSFDVNLNTLLKRKRDLKDAVVTENCVQREDFDTKAIFGTELY